MTVFTPSKISIIYMGTPEFACLPLRSLFEAGFNILAVITQPDKPKGRHMELTPPPVKLVAEELALPVYQPVSIRDISFIKFIEGLKPNLIVTAAYGKILPIQILDIPEYCINIHASLLPKYRGAAPVQHSIFNGEAFTGVTIMLMDAGIDTGDIIMSSELPIEKNIAASDLTDLLSQLGASIITNAIEGLLNGQIKPVKQDNSVATVIRPISKEDGRIDWKHSASDIHNRIRGCHPWPGAYTYFNNKRMKIISSVVHDVLPIQIDIPDSSNVPGTLVRNNEKNRLFVICGDGYIEILSLHLEGSKPMAADSCAHNFPQFGKFQADLIENDQEE